jgi:hypothetical protein
LHVTLQVKTELRNEADPAMARSQRAISVSGDRLIIALKGDVFMFAVKLNDEKAREALIRRPGFEVPLFRGSLFNVNPFTLMRRFTEDMDRAFGTVPGTGEILSWSPTVEVKQVNW